MSDIKVDGRKVAGHLVPSKRIDVTDGGPKEISKAPLKKTPSLGKPYNLKFGAKKDTPEDVESKPKKNFSPRGADKIEKTKKIGG